MDATVVGRTPIAPQPGRHAWPPPSKDRRAQSEFKMSSTKLGMLDYETNPSNMRPTSRDARKFTSKLRAALPAVATPARRRRAAVAVITAAGLVAALVASPPANAGGNQYVERRCLIPAMVGDGMAGGKCNSYSKVAVWKNTSKGGLPDWARKAIAECIAGGLAAVSTAWYAKTPASAAVTLAVGCVAPPVAKALTGT